MRPKPTTMKDIAVAAGVSAMTVSRAMRDDRLVSEAKRREIRHLAERMGYVLDSIAANLRRQRTGFVAVTIPSINNANFANMTGALSSALAEHDLQVLLGSPNYNVAEEERLIRQLLQRRPEALVVTSGQHRDGAHRQMRNAGIPIVETWDIPDDPIGQVIGFSNARASRITVDHLLAQGFRRIAFIGGDTAGDTCGADRRRGFIDAMRDHGVDPFPAQIGAATAAHILSTLSPAPSE
jgi:LacI family gluconate utilization system Gnt-I transcriptional repressor